MLARACAVARVALLIVLLHEASAAFYSKGSDVVAISDAAGLKRLQRSNYLWVLEFYREGCGYCVQAAPEYEKAATSLKRMVGFAAVDVEKNQGIAGQLMQAFGVEVKGVPTIVMLKPTSKGMTKIDYPGERTAAAFTSAAKQHMPSYTVKLNQKTWEAFDGDTTLARAVVFTDKAEPTAMIKALSAKFRNRLKIAVVSKSDKGIAKILNVTSYPALRVLPAGSSSQTSEAVHFTGKVSLFAIDLFLMDHAKPAASGDSADAPKQQTQGGKAAKGKDEGGKTAKGKDAPKDGGKAAKDKDAPKDGGKPAKGKDAPKEGNDATKEEKFKVFKEASGSKDKDKGEGKGKDKGKDKPKTGGAEKAEGGKKADASKGHKEKGGKSGAKEPSKATQEPPVYGGGAPKKRSGDRKGSEL